MNIDSADNSTNLSIATAPVVFKELGSAILAELNDPEAQPVVASLQDLESSLGTPEFSDRYKAFITTAASHTAIVAPFVPALTGLLT